MKTFEDYKTFLDGQSLDRADHSRLLKIYKAESTHPVPDGGNDHLYRMVRAAKAHSDADVAVVQAFIDS